MARPTVCVFVALVLVNLIGVDAGTRVRRSFQFGVYGGVGGGFGSYHHGLGTPVYYPSPHLYAGYSGSGYGGPVYGGPVYGGHVYSGLGYGHEYSGVGYGGLGYSGPGFVGHDYGGYGGLGYGYGGYHGGLSVAHSESLSVGGLSPTGIYG